MAGSPPSENSVLFDAAESSNSTQPAPVDWEMLSMSTMSASTLGLSPQKPHESEAFAALTDQICTEKELSDASVEPFSASQQETHHTDSYTSDKDKEHEDIQPPVGPPLEALGRAQGSDIREEVIPALPSNKKKIRVLWWKHQVFNWQPQSKKYSTMLSIALVAAVVGIAVIGHRLHRERNINHQLRIEVLSKEEKLNDMMYQVNRMKEAMTGRRRVGVTRSSLF